MLKTLSSWLRRINILWLILIPFLFWIIENLVGDWIINNFESRGLTIPNIIQWALSNPLASSLVILILTLSFLLIMAYREALDEIDISLEPVQRHNNKSVSIKVNNNRLNRSVFCTPYIKRIVWIYNPTTEIDITDKINEYNKELSWEGGSESPEVEIKPQKDEIINIARFVGNQVVSTFYGPEPNHPCGKFKIWVDVLCRTDITVPRYFYRRLFGCIETYGEQGLLLSAMRIWECEDVVEWKVEAGIEG